jgi:predicted extracellular nuclease
MSLHRPFTEVRRWSLAAAGALALAACADRPELTAPVLPGSFAPSLNVAASVGPKVVISQVYGGGGNSGAPLQNDFVELFNAGDANATLTGLSIQYASATGTGNFGASSGLLVALTGTLAPGQYYLVQLGGGANGVALPTPDATGTINASASAGKFALVNGTAGLGCNGGSTPCSAEQVALILDLVGYGNANFFEGSAAAPTLSNTTAALRGANGCTDSDNNGADFAAGTPSPRNSASPLAPCGPAEPPPPPPPPAQCSDDVIPAFTIQGSGAASPLAGQSVTTRGVVVGDYEGPSPALRGFYLQDATGDGDPATSDAVFVFNADRNDVQLGDVVAVTGTVAEFQGQTQVSATTVVVCGTGTVAPVDVTLPVPSPDFLERYEGMLVRLPQALTVTEHFQLGRFGQVVLSSGGRLRQPTDVAAPGAAAAAVQAANDLNRIIVDDELQNQNRDPILFGRGGSPLSASNTLRGGDEVRGVVGVLTFTWAGNAASGNAYRVRPVGALGGGIPAFAAVNERPATVPAVGGTIRVASFNLLNYFNTFSGCRGGVNGAATACRGANDAAEFARQRAKTLAALRGLQADVIGVIELENDGYGPTSAIQDLVDGLNETAGAGAWAFIDADAATGQVDALGTDAIKVALLYRTSAVQPTGRTAVLNTIAFVNGGDTGPRNRATIAQAFVRTADRARVIVSVQHLKSKGSACDAPDAGDGQGNCGAVRTRAVEELLAWLGTDPTDTGEKDVLIVGDFNAYAKEDPIARLEAAGYVNLVSRFDGADAYSFAFDGQWGSLDHAMASRSLAAQVAGAADWHINADEPNVLDYNVEFKSANLQASLYAPDPFRSADHDPLVVGLSLRAPAVTYDFGGLLPPYATAERRFDAKPGAVLPIRFTLGGRFGTNVFVEGFPAVQPVECESGAPLGPRTPIDRIGRNSLSLSWLTGVYLLLWKSEPSWEGSCRALTLRFRDETQQTVVFRFRD